MTIQQRNMIEKLFIELFEKLLIYAHCSLGNYALAEEAVQETFAIACTKSDSLCSNPNPQGWIMNTLKNVVSNMHKRRAVATKIVSEYLGDKIDVLPGPEDQLDLTLLYGNVADSKEFRLVWAISQEGKSMLELANEMGISVSACRKRVERAKKILQRRIK